MTHFIREAMFSVPGAFLNLSYRRGLLVLYVIVVSAAVYLFAHQDAITNPYVVMDDACQQLYWMQRWLDPGLFQDDLLSRYAQNYVPWGVQAIYAAASPLFGPVQFSKVVAGVLYVVTALFVFGLGLRFRDDLTAVFMVAVYCFSPFFLVKISGGLSQGFAFPLLAAYLYFLSQDKVFVAGVVVLAASLLNPYIFLLCLVTHALYLGWYWRKEVINVLRLTQWPRLTEREALAQAIRHFPVVLGIALMAMKYLIFSPHEFGDLVTRADMMGRPEYSTAGRYEILPGATLLLELIMPGIQNLSFNEWGLIAGLISLALFVAGGVCAFRHWRKFLDPMGFRVFFFLCPASLILYGIAWLVLFRLFLPERYVEFPLNIFYVVVAGISMRAGFGMLVSDRVAFPAVATLIVLMGGLKLYHVGITDYSAQAELYEFIKSTPKQSVFAGNTRLMDGVVTFGHRVGFVTYELSHPWFKGYWKVIDQRTSELFDAYYSDDPELVRGFCRKNGIDYLVVREEDFLRDRIGRRRIHFEPFDGRIRKIVVQRSSFALLNKKEFPPIYYRNGVRVLKLSDVRRR